MAGKWIDRSGEMEVMARLVQAGSLSAAARSLGLSPSAISRTLQRIEARLGVRLVTRTTRAIALTPEGEAYHRSCLRILAELEQAEREITDQSILRGKLRVTTSLAFGSRCLVPLLPPFLTQHPGVRVEVNLTDTVVDLVLERTDVAIRVGPLSSSSLTARKIGENRRVVVAAPSYLAAHGTPAVPDDLLKHNCLEFNFRRATTGWPFRIAGHEQVLPISGNVEANNGETIRQMAVAGIGIARLGLFLVEEDLRAKTLVPLLEAYNPNDAEQVNLLFLAGPTMPRRVRAFVTYLADAMRQQEAFKPPA
jgi:DNA-binding transcriptional LysR family regulator